MFFQFVAVLFFEVDHQQIYNVRQNTVQDYPEENPKYKEALTQPWVSERFCARSRTVITQKSGIADTVTILVAYTFIGAFGSLFIAVVLTGDCTYHNQDQQNKSEPVLSH